MLKLIQDDLWLEPYAAEIYERLERYQLKREQIERRDGSIVEFAAGHEYFGWHFDEEKSGWWYREWAPGARSLHAVGDFNNWENTFPMKAIGQGVWEIFIPSSQGPQHGGKVKVRIKGDTEFQDRIPAYIRYAVQDSITHEFSGCIWNPAASFKWMHEDAPLSQGAPIIYEAHVGMAQEKEGVGTYRQFADETLPRIKAGGYNTVQLMAIAEHPYYGSFGYHVANYFAPSSRFGTPDDLKYLVDQAHGLGLRVIMDLVHSHAVKNTAEGLNGFDGTNDQYFHPGDRGFHPGWDSMLFNYGKTEVLQFLLSNVQYWLKEFQFDGYRYDGVTSMMYWHHGEGLDFDHYDKYFREGVEHDCLVYLQLANKLAHEVRENVMTIAEDMSGMPGMCRTVEDGGLGFDYRLGMGIPDYWIKLLKHQADQEWSVQEMVDTLMNRRYTEKTIAYAESHDQAMVGDKTLAFWLMDQDMYWHMKKGDDSLVVDRGIAIHKMIRLITATVGGEGYLNFIGNEFGHPEWIDFPREGNDWSYQHARRQWSLVDNDQLRYVELAAFDKAMLDTIAKEKILEADPAQQVHYDAYNKVVVLERNNLLFAFNFHWENSIFDYRFRPHLDLSFELILSSDDAKFGGHDRVEVGSKHFTDVGELSIYLPNRTALIFKKVL